MSTQQNTARFGLHYMLDGYGADPDLLKDIPTLRNFLEKIPVAMGMHTISQPVVVEVGPKNQKDPGGVSGFVLIAESHMSFHTFPKRGFITIDVYTCQDTIDTEKLTQEFVAAFKLTDYEQQVINRGLSYPVENIYN